MTALELVRLNLLSPMVLGFVLGIVASLVRSDLKLPESIYAALSIYLLFAIGLKGGAELSETSLAAFAAPALATLALGVATPLWTYAAARRLARFDVADAAALAAHYGSVSVVTFTASLTFIESAGVAYEGFMPTLVVLLEVPAILVALLIARRKLGGAGSWGKVLHEVLAGKSSLLLLGGLVIGFLAGKHGFAQVKPFFGDPFKGILTLFLLEMGMLTAGRFGDLRKAGARLVIFGVAAPLVHGALGVWAGQRAGLSMGGAAVLGVMAASASYIAAPIAVRIALPQANPGYYLTASLAITFPFNLAAGIPLYYALAARLYGGGSP